MDHQGSSRKVAESLVAPVAQHGHDADGIEAGQRVDNADQVARHRLEQCDLPAGVADHAQLAELLPPAFWPFQNASNSVK